MTPHLRALQRFLSQKAGLALDASGVFLAQSQLAPLAQERGHSSVDALIAEMLMGQDRALAQRALEALTTHETMFFRDRLVFEQVRTAILPALISARAATRRLRIWCAAASTGQEPYSIAMLLDDEARRLNGWSVDILASDLSDRALDVARAATYSQFEVQRGLPVSYLLRYFTRADENWRLADPVRARVKIRQHNLIEDFAKFGAFDIILCRNVLIYFDAAARGQVVNRLASALSPGGYLLLGATEMLNGNWPGIAPLPYHPSIGFKSLATRPPLRLVAGG